MVIGKMEIHKNDPDVAPLLSKQTRIVCGRRCDFLIEPDCHPSKTVEGKVKVST